MKVKVKIKACPHRDISTTITIIRLIILNNMYNKKYLYSLNFMINE